jgi:hypothetical protein
MPDEEPEWVDPVFEGHEQVAGCWMVHAGGVPGNSEEMHPVGAHLDREQDRESAKADCVEVEEVDCEQAGGLGAKEGSLAEVGSPWCWTQPSVREDSAYVIRAPTW